MKKFSLLAFLFLILLVTGCSHRLIKKYGNHYQKHNDIESLKKVVDLMGENADTAFVREILGEPIDFGFDFRYMTGEVSENHCAIGAVFHIDTAGKIDQKWVGEICE